MRNRMFLVLFLVITTFAAQNASTQTAVAPLVIDDFTEGQYRRELSNNTRTDQRSGSPTHIVGGVRQTVFNAAQLDSPFTRSTILEIPRGGPMFVESGVKSAFGLILVYGVDRRGNNDPLNLKLQQMGYERFRINFESSDLELSYLMQVFDGDGDVATLTGNVSTDNQFIPFHVDFPFAGFEADSTGPINWNDIDFVVAIFQTGNATGGGDFAVTSIVAR